MVDYPEHIERYVVDLSKPERMAYFTGYRYGLKRGHDIAVAEYPIVKLGVAVVFTAGAVFGVVCVVAGYFVGALLW